MGIENYQNEILTFFIYSIYRYICLLTAVVYTTRVREVFVFLLDFCALFFNLRNRVISEYFF
jgi:hypothetical protein